VRAGRRQRPAFKLLLRAADLGEAEAPADAITLAMLAFFEPSRALMENANSDRPWVLSPTEARQLASWQGLRAAFLSHGRVPGHPALIDPGALVPFMGPTDGDLDLLMSVAAELGHAPLFRRAAEESVRNPWPRVRPPSRPTQLAPDLGAFAQVVRRERNMHNLLSWGSTLGRLTDSDWAAIIWGRQEVALEPDLWWNATFLGLVSLGLVSPERLRQLSGALPESWADPLREAEATVEQLRGPLRGRLHPEIEALRALLADGSLPPDRLL
jgi:hypothetical protein